MCQQGLQEETDKLVKAVIVIPIWLITHWRWCTLRFTDDSNLWPVANWKKHPYEKEYKVNKICGSAGMPLGQSVQMWRHIYRPDYNYLDFTLDVYDFTLGMSPNKCPTNFQYNLAIYRFLKKWANPGLFSVFLVFLNKQYNFLQQIYVKNVNPVYGARIRTHNLWNVSLFPWPLDQDSRPTQPYVSIGDALTLCNTFHRLHVFHYWLYPLVCVFKKLYRVRPRR